MRFMMIVKASQESEAGGTPDPKMMAEVGMFNEEMVKAGVLLSAEGLQSSAKGARIQITKGKRTVVDGPFAETKELIAGYWLIQVNSRQEAIDWALRAPAPHGDGVDTNIEVRQVGELEDFGPDLPQKIREQEEKLRAELAKKK
jgi:hypothetical protein